MSAYPDVKARLQLCMTCQLREFDKVEGVRCSLTHAKPTFTNSCSDYKAQEVQPDFSVRHLRKIQEERNADRRRDPIFFGPRNFIMSFVQRNSKRALAYMLVFCIVWIAFSFSYGTAIPWVAVVGAFCFGVALLLSVLFPD